MTSSFHLLCALCQPDPDGGTDPTRRDEGATIDWQALIALAQEHDVLPLVAHRLATRWAARLPSDTADGLALFNEGQRRRTGELGRQLRDLLLAMSEAGIPVIALKGPPLGRRLYRQAWLRRMRDLDILVHAEDVDRTLDLLIAQGYVHERDLDRRGQALLRRYAGQYLMLHPARAPVEPHWLIAPRTLAFGLDHARMWRSAQSEIFRGAPHLALSDGDTLLMLCLHGAKDRWRQLKHVTDVAFFLRAHPDLDWQAVEATARSEGCHRIFSLGLLLANRLLHAEIPAPLLQRVAANPAIERLAARAIATLRSEATTADGPYVICREYWAMHERLRDRCAYALRTATQPRPAHYRRLPLPAGLRWAYPALKLPWDFLLTPMTTLVRRVAGHATAMSR